MTEIFLNPTTNKAIAALKHNTPQALLISGPIGCGLQTVANLISDGNSHIVYPEKDEKIDLENGTIGVKLIRNLYEETRSKLNRKNIFIIKNADRMTSQAQNAFLKLLEEPNSGTYFILLSHTPTKLLPTISSRTEQLSVRPINRQQSDKLLDILHISDQTKRAQIQFLASGLPAAMTRLATDDKYFATRTATTHNAREILQTNCYQKLKIIQTYKDSRSDALLLLSDIMKIMNYSIRRSYSIDLISRLNNTLDAYQNIEQNGNIRLNLATLVL